MYAVSQFSVIMYMWEQKKEQVASQDGKESDTVSMGFCKMNKYSLQLQYKQAAKPLNASDNTSFIQRFQVHKRTLWLFYSVLFLYTVEFLPAVKFLQAISVLSYVSCGWASKTSFRKASKDSKGRDKHYT